MRFDRERFELSDGDFVDLDWHPTQPKEKKATRIVMVLHGLAGSSESPYIRDLVPALKEQGLTAAVMHFRGCSGEPNRRARSYHAGDTKDVVEVAKALQKRSELPLACVGYSLGGNALLKLLGEHPAISPFQSAVAVSVPFDLHRCNRALSRGFSRIYTEVLLRQLRLSLEQKFSPRASPFSWTDMMNARTFYDFDNVVTAPLHGFRSADEYYTTQSSRSFLRRVRTRTLVLHAADDPFVPLDAVPRGEELSESVRLELSDSGGHVAFVEGGTPVRPEVFLPRRIAAFLCARSEPTRIGGRRIPTLHSYP